MSTAPDAQSPKFTNSAQGLVPDINIKERLMRSRSFVPCYNKSNSDAQSPKLTNSAQGPEPDTINKARLVRSRSFVPCYNKSHFN